MTKKLYMKKLMELEKRKKTLENIIFTCYMIPDVKADIFDELKLIEDKITKLETKLGR